MSQIGWVARRSVRRTLRQPALIVPTIVFPLFLLAVNASGLAAATSSSRASGSPRRPTARSAATAAA